MHNPRKDPAFRRRKEAVVSYRPLPWVGVLPSEGEAPVLALPLLKFVPDPRRLEFPEPELPSLELDEPLWPELPELLLLPSQPTSNEAVAMTNKIDIFISVSITARCGRNEGGQLVYGMRG